MRGPLALCALAAMASRAAADPLKLPNADYVADVAIAQDGNAPILAEHVFAGKRMRVTIENDVYVFDFAKNRFFRMSAKGKTATPELDRQLPDARLFAGVAADTAEPVGRDSILGRAVTKYRVSGKFSPQSRAFEGFVWTTPENIVLRAEGTLRADDGATALAKWETMRLKVGQIAPAMFEVPADYKRLTQ